MNGGPLIPFGQAWKKVMNADCYDLGVTPASAVSGTSGYVAARVRPGAC